MPQITETEFTKKRNRRGRHFMALVAGAGAIAMGGAAHEAKTTSDFLENSAACYMFLRVGVELITNFKITSKYAAFANKKISAFMRNRDLLRKESRRAKK